MICSQVESIGHSKSTQTAEEDVSRSAGGTEDASEGAAITEDASDISGKIEEVGGKAVLLTTGGRG